MNKRVIIIAVVLLVIGGGVGLFLKSHNSSKNDNQVSNTSVKSVGLDLNSLLASLKKQYPTVQDTYVYSESRDPNNNLGKAGFYVAGAEFYDSRTNTSPDGEAFGADSGGAIEIYSNSSDATKRVEYLKTFQGNSLLDPGAFKQVGKVVVRASSKYTASQQSEMINYLASQVQ